MPCNDYPSYYQTQDRKLEKYMIENADLRKQAELHVRLEAMLCAVLTSAEKSKMSWATITEAIDETEAGVTAQEIIDWFTQHKLQDERRREEETRQQLERLRSSGRAKLTPEEIAALGLTPN